MQGIKKKTKAGQQRAEDRVEQGRSRPPGARPLGMQKSPLSAGTYTQLVDVLLMVSDGQCRVQGLPAVMYKQLRPKSQPVKGHPGRLHQAYCPDVDVFSTCAQGRLLKHQRPQ